MSSPSRSVRIHRRSAFTGWALRSAGWVVAAATFAWLAVGCFVDELDLSGKACPCTDGWVCETATNSCVQATAAPAGGSGGTGTGSGLGGEGEGGSTPTGPGAITVSNLHVAWTTPGWIRWEWDSSGPADQLLRYELVTGASAEDVSTRTGSAVVWSAEQNPELGRFLLPATGSEDPVVFTMTDGHEPSTEYYGMLTAVDTASRRSTSNVAAGRTTDPPVHELVIFSDEPTAGYSIPDTFVLSEREPYAGTHHYEYELDVCPEPSASQCYEIIRRQGLGQDLSDISQGAFSTTAFVEFALATGGPMPSYWSELRIGVGTAGDADFYGYGAWTIRADGAYRLYQIPLRALGMSTPIPYDALARGLWEFGVGGSWAAGAPTMVDEIRFYW